MARILAGSLLVLLGIVMAATPVMTSFAAGLLWAALLMASGIVQIVAAFRLRPPRWGWFALAGLIPIVASALLFTDPVAGVIGLTVLITAFLLVAGAWRILLSIAFYPAEGWGWILVHGIVSLVLGFYVLSRLPAIGFFLPGTLLAIETIASGISTIAAGFRGEVPVEPTRGVRV